MDRPVARGPRRLGGQDQGPSPRRIRGRQPGGRAVGPRHGPRRRGRLRRRKRLPHRDEEGRRRGRPRHHGDGIRRRPRRLLHRPRPPRRRLLRRAFHPHGAARRNPVRPRLLRQLRGRLHPRLLRAAQKPKAHRGGARARAAGGRRRDPRRLVAPAVRRRRIRGAGHLRVPRRSRRPCKLSRGQPAIAGRAHRLRRSDGPRLGRAADSHRRGEAACRGPLAAGPLLRVPHHLRRPRLGNDSLHGNRFATALAAGPWRAHRVGNQRGRRRHVGFRSDARKAHRHGPHARGRDRPLAQSPGRTGNQGGGDAGVAVFGRDRPRRVQPGAAVDPLV